jgi:hypothetical protein
VVTQLRLCTGQLHGQMSVASVSTPHSVSSVCISLCGAALSVSARDLTCPQRSFALTKRGCRASRDNLGLSRCTLGLCGHLSGISHLRHRLTRARSCAVAVSTHALKLHRHGFQPAFGGLQHRSPAVCILSGCHCRMAGFLRSCPLIGSIEMRLRCAPGSGLLRLLCLSQLTTQLRNLQLHSGNLRCTCSMRRI